MPDPDPPTVLIAEDEPLVRLLMSDVLLEAGFRVIEAANASEALTVLETGLPVSVLVTDVEMPPGINGYDLARLVHERWPGVEILVCSARQWPGDGSLPPGAAFLAKPCPIDSFVSYVRSAGERAQAAAPQQLEADQMAAGGGQVLPFAKKG